MRETRDDSSAGSTPPPSNLEDFWLPSFNDLLSPPPAGAGDGDDEVLRGMAQDGWFFFSDNHHGHAQPSTQPPPQQLTFRSAASEPFRQTNSGAGAASLPLRPPKPSLLRERRKRERDGVERMAKAQESRNRSLASENNKDNASSTESDEDEIQSDLPPNEKRPPEVGMEFFSEDEAYEFYKKYANEVGFCVRKGKVQRLANGAIRKRNFLCSRQGFKWRKMSNDEIKKFQRKETRTGCKASIQLTVEDGKWLVSSFISGHNHELGNPEMAHLIDSFSNGFSKTTFEGEDEPPESFRVQEVNSFNCLSSRALNVLQPEDVQSLMNSFIELQLEDPGFFYTAQFDAANRVTNIFWRDFGSSLDYAFFGDVFVFDSTCRIDNLVCASFWGLDHHHRRVSFGSALLFDETLESFLWLFRAMTVSMENRHPKTVYSTDESREIADAIECVFPKATHCLFANNVYKNAKRQLQREFEQEGFEESFEKCIFGCQSKDEFELHWESMMQRYDLRGNPWLATLHKMWEKWSNLFRQKTFTAGIELFFDTPNTDSPGQKSPREITSLADFVHKYVDEAQKSRSEELREDSRCSKMVSKRSTKGMEKHAEDLYTRAIFKIFQEELLDSLSLSIEELTSSGTISTFKLTEEGHKNEYIVTFDSSNSSVTCSCGKFESFGILCGHCIKVLNAKNIFQIPAQYVLKRWTKSAKEELFEDGSKEDQTRKESSYYSRNIMHKTLQIISKSKGNKESRNMVEGYLDSALKKADEILKAKGTEQTNATSLELDSNASFAADSVRDLRNQKITSNSSCINEEEGSKSTVRIASRRKKICRNNQRRIEGSSQDQSLYQSGGVTSEQFGGNNDTVINHASQAESQAMQRFIFDR